ncbi:MAG: hypothetical protein IIU08_07745 [Clostridia bacterium]|nr:hypothetical protein [Clostridia bacterium]MBQ5355746.1 hypothetical protein [Clostridia bacterium]
MKKPDFHSLPRDFRDDYAKFAALRLAGSGIVMIAAAAACFFLDFSGLKYPAMGAVFVLAVGIAVSCVLFGLHRFAKPAWQGEITDIDCGFRLANTGQRGRAERQLMVDLIVDRGEKKPYAIRLFREDGVTHGKVRINVFQTEAPYKTGDTLLFLPGFRYPARMDVKDAAETLDPKFVCPFCGWIGPLSRENCYKCGRTVLK